jgi:hypothetical protein
MCTAQRLASDSSSLELTQSFEQALKQTLKIREEMIIQGHLDFFFLYLLDLGIVK